MVAVVKNKLLTIVGCGEKNVGVVVLDKLTTLLRRFAHNDAFGVMQHYREQGADACWTCANDENCVFILYLTYASCPETCSKHIANKKRLFISHVIWYSVQPLGSKRHTHIFCLPSIYTTA